jgi:two-component sensor histidine kinase
MDHTGHSGSAWIHRQLDRPLGWTRRLLVSLAAIVAMAAVRLAVEPIIGADISFTAFFPIIILAVLSGGLLGGAATIVAGSLIALAFSAGAPSLALRPDAASRMIVWLISSLAVASVALGLRRTMAMLTSRSADLQDAADQLELVVGELEHRGKNALSIVQALSRETARQSADVEEYERSLSAKIQALSASYAFLTRRRLAPIPLESLVVEALAVFRPRISIDGGPAARMQPQASMALVLVLHELATNAAKYGALSVHEGKVALGWKVEGSLLSLIWTERQGPRPVAQSYRGFGSRLIQRAFERLPAGSVKADFQPSGLVCTLTVRFGPEGPAMPESDAQSSADTRAGAGHDPEACPGSPGAGSRLRRAFWRG